MVIPIFALMGELWAIYRKDVDENGLPCYDTPLYVSKTTPSFYNVNM